MALGWDCIKIVLRRGGIFLAGSGKVGVMRLRIGFLAGLAGLLIAPGAYAQNCALCYATASALGSAAAHSLDVGILALLTPALSLFAGVFYLLYRRATAASA